MAHIDIVFDGPPGHNAGRFVDVEDENGRSISFGAWMHRPDNFWALRIRKAEYEQPAFPHGMLSPWRIEHLLSGYQEKIMSLMDDIKAALARNEDDEAKLIAVLQTTLASNVDLSNKLAAAIANGGDQTALQSIKDQLDADNTTMQNVITSANPTPTDTSSSTTPVDPTGGTVTSQTDSGSVDSGGSVTSSGTVDNGGTVLGTGTVDSGGDNAGTVSNTGTI